MKETGKKNNENETHCSESLVEDAVTGAANENGDHEKRGDSVCPPGNQEDG